MKRLSFIAILGLLLFASCENRNGGEQKFESIKCHPSLSWLEKFLPMPDMAQGGPKKLTPPAPDSGREYYDAYQYSHFLRVTVPDANTLKFMHHTEFPCAYSVKGHVDLQNNKIVLREEMIKPVTFEPIPPCLCGATISSSATVSHLDYDTIELEGLSLPIHLYEGLDTLIMIHTDVPEEPTVCLTVSGLLLDSYGRNLREAQVVLQDQSSTVLDTLYTNRDGYFHNNFIAIDKVQASDTLSVIVLEPFHNYYDTTKIAFADMDVEYDPWSIHYYASIEKQLKNNNSYEKD